MTRRLVLASTSPRRRRLLEEAGYAFDVVAPDVDETPPPGVAPREVARLLAERKARAVDAPADAWVVAADTLLDFHGSIVGKPRDAEDARRILLHLSATVHDVVTGVVVRHGDALVSDVAVTRIRFRSLSPQEIGAYVETGEPLDKAGAYAVQGGARGFVEAMDGPLDNVVGLPMAVVQRLLAKTGYG
jgi:septum formation protein